jgi:hypothetical protein
VLHDSGWFVLRTPLPEQNIRRLLVTGRPSASFALPRADPHARGLHSSTFQLNLSALYGIGDARRRCAVRVQGVFGGVEGV